jgi:hypothetical protein
MFKVGVDRFLQAPRHPTPLLGFAMTSTVGG